MPHTLKFQHWKREQQILKNFPAQVETKEADNKVAKKLWGKKKEPKEQQQQIFVKQKLQFI